MASVRFIRDATAGFGRPCYRRGEVISDAPIMFMRAVVHQGVAEWVEKPKERIEAPIQKPLEQKQAVKPHEEEEAVKPQEEEEPKKSFRKTKRKKKSDQ